MMLYSSNTLYSFGLRVNNPKKISIYHDVHKFLQLHLHYFLTIGSHFLGFELFQSMLDSSMAIERNNFRTSRGTHREIMFIYLFLTEVIYLFIY